MALKQQIGFGGVAEAFSCSRWYQSQPSTPVCRNENEMWSISQPKSQQTVIETQRRMGNRGV